MGNLHGEHALEKERETGRGKKKKKDINRRPRIASNTGEATLTTRTTTFCCVVGCLD